MVWFGPSFRTVTEGLMLIWCHHLRLCGGGGGGGGGRGGGMSRMARASMAESLATPRMPAPAQRAQAPTQYLASSPKSFIWEGIVGDLHIRFSTHWSSETSSSSCRPAVPFEV